MVSKLETFGLMKTLLDAHTMGIYSATALLADCGYNVLIAPVDIQDALDKISNENCQERVTNWIIDNHITRLGFSYRLDPQTAIEIVGKIVMALKKRELYESLGAQVKSIHFAGLKKACDFIDKEYEGRIRTFRGGESVEETLLVMGIPQDEIPLSITKGCKYDKDLLNFGKDVINKLNYNSEKPLERVLYPEYGTIKDTLQKRLKYNFEGGFQPLIRAHSGPFSSNISRKQCLKEYNEWCQELAQKGFLDILSIGSSQLSQSNFGEDWGERINGGGVPVNSEIEYIDIWQSSRPMLVRTYSGTKNVLPMAQMYEKTINNAWNALSLWWFDELDGRGPNNLLNNLYEHVKTIDYVASIGKPLETNVPHHFAFRGCDDVTYIVSAYLAAKMSKICGIKSFILQNMLNTPRSTWGIQDLAKSRAMIRLVKSLEDNSFKVILQTRAGLDYFKPDIEQAKIQLAAVTGMMDDIDPDNALSPEIIHVVSYSEALFLATPSVLNESIQITRASLKEYRRLKGLGNTPDVNTDDIKMRTQRLFSESQKLIYEMEKNIPNLYSPEGLYLAFVAGWLPVPELWSDKDEFLHAKCWETKMIDGGISVVDRGLIMPIESRVNKCVTNMTNALYLLKSKHGITLDCISE